MKFLETVSHKVFPDRFHFSLKKGEGRDVLATGAAVGICVAFRAPLAGCLFVVEEAASFFAVEHLEYTFFATVIAYMVALALTGSDEGESFTKFKQATGYFCTLYDIFDIALFVCIALLGGVTGALFNKIVETLNAWRGKHINGKVWSRVTELVLLTLVSGTVCIFLPYFWDCKHPTRSMLMEDSMGCLSEEDALQISHGAVSHSALTELLANSSQSTQKQQQIADLLSKYRAPEDGVGHSKWKDMVWIDNADEISNIHLHYQHEYTCDEGDYNGMSMLWLNGGVKAVKVLLQRGFPNMLSWDVLFVFWVVYFLLAAYTSGVCVPAGLIVPLLLIGGAMGRCFGLLGIAMKKGMCDELHDLDVAAAATNPLYWSNSTGSGDPSDWMFDNTYYWSTIYRWVARDCRLPDPGMYAVVGMAAFLSGSGRITLFLATVLIELTDDASLIGPVGVASIISMIVGNMFNHGLYHGLIPVMNMPYLNSEPADVMSLVSVGAVMTRPVLCLSVFSKVKDIKDLLHRCDIGEVTHNAFPVVDDEGDGRKKLRGMISLLNLRLTMDSSEATKRVGSNNRRRRLITGSDPVTAFAARDMTDEVLDQISEWLLHVPLMHDLSYKARCKIARGMKIGVVSAGTEIVHVGEPGKAMYFVDQGEACARVRGATVFSYSRGGFFGELALLTDSPRKATVSAGAMGAHVWRLDRTTFEETLGLDNRDLKLMNFADRSPITTVPHAKVARAFEIFRKLGMRHMCVIDSDGAVAGMITRKDLMTYKISENIIPPRAEALIRRFLYHWHAKHMRQSGSVPGTPRRGLRRTVDAEVKPAAADAAADENSEFGSLAVTRGAVPLPAPHKNDDTERQIEATMDAAVDVMLAKLDTDELAGATGSVPGPVPGLDLDPAP